MKENKTWYGGVGEPLPGDKIEVDQIKEGDKIRKTPTDLTNNPNLIATEYVARYDADPFGLSRTYEFTLLERKPEPEPGSQYPTLIGALIKPQWHVPVVLTNKGWQFVGEYSDTTRYFTAAELEKHTHNSTFDVLYGGYESRREF